VKDPLQIVRRHSTHQDRRSFLPPVAVLVVCGVFIALILTMGLITRQSIDRTLTRFMEERAQGFVGVVERLAQENIDNLNRLVQEQSRQGGRFTPLSESMLATQRSFMASLVEIAKEVDREWKEGRLSDASLKQLAQERGIWLVAALNRSGVSVHSSRLLPGDAGGGAGESESRPVTLEALNRLSEKKRISFIALRRPDGSGTTVVALDSDTNRSFGTKISVERALRELGKGQGLVYLEVMDPRGRLLGSLGKQPKAWAEGDVPLAQVLSGSQAVYSRKVTFDGHALFDFATPLKLNDQVAGYARVGLDRDAVDQILTENERQIFIFAALVMAIMLLSMWFLYQSQNRHIARIVEMERRLEKAERLSALGKLAAGVAHEIRNPLNAISMASQRLKREHMPAEEAKSGEFEVLTGVIRDEIRRLNGIIEEFLTFSRSRRLELHEYPVSEVLQKIVNLIRAEADEKGIAIETRWGEPPVVIPMDVDKLQQALLNFIKNAMESMENSGTLTLATGRSARGRVSIRVADTGCGMTAEQVEQIFNPEYTTKEKGLGLGLPLAHEIIRGHGGEIRVTSRQGGGTTFEIFLPAERVGSKA
jgi:signal transduction histidine kinase